MPSIAPSDVGLKLAVLERLGLRADPPVLSTLADALGQLASEQRLPVSTVFARCLGEPLSSELLTRLAERLSVGESSFFRHRAHFDALEQAIIAPIRLARPTGGMRVLSAGCAKGEEPYSLAISCQRAWPGGAHQVVGLDVSEAAVRAARAGRFRAWSMRGIDPSSLAPWVTAVDGDQWEVGAPLRRCVDWVTGNLLALPAEVQRRAPFDLIFCRNVLIYFSREAGRGVARSLAGLLGPDGVLVVGPADHDFCVDLACRAQDNVYFYALEQPGGRLSAPPPGEAKTWPPSPRPVLAVPPAVGGATEPAPRPASERYHELLCRGRAARDLGREEEALRLFDQSIALVPERPEGYFEQALLLDHRRLFPPARELLERALYLDPCFIPAMVILSRVLGATGYGARSRALLESLELALREIPPTDPVTGWAEMTAGTLRKSCQSLLRSAVEGGH